MSTKFNILTAARTASDSAKKVMKSGTHVIRNERFLRVFFPMEKGKIFTSDQNYDVNTGTLVTVEESVLVKPEGQEMQSGIVGKHVGLFVETRSMSFYAFNNVTPTSEDQCDMLFFADAARTTEIEVPTMTDEQLIAQLKNVLTGKTQRQWRNVKDTELKDLREKAK